MAEQIQPPVIVQRSPDPGVPPVVIASGPRAQGPPLEAWPGERAADDTGPIPVISADGFDLSPDHARQMVRDAIAADPAIGALEAQPEDAAKAAAAEQRPGLRAPMAAPVLLHSGTYAVYLTPAGRYHVAYTPTAEGDEQGIVRALEGEPTKHLRELPERPAELVAMVLNPDAQLPPVFQAFLDTGTISAGGIGAMVAQIRQAQNLFGGSDD